ncbi:hypothetical protein [Rhizobium ruizarguesonis]|uniref:hypothetical protein n=1 Tax=Rhizobium ruizarguesonis TaxID=2081791 RepID=UPI00102FB477|nr:hypothetical protein [Rhizobium ruizarguesonis]TBC84264.1 hypothetical protein ELH28_16505 [Rhizobium ruizarguesonis]
MPVSLKKAIASNASSIDLETRRATWLGSPYETHKWILKDTAGEGEDETVDFDVRMADGKSLIEHPHLYATFKELVFWIRSGNYTNIEDAKRHAQYAQTLLRICYGMTARGFFSFSALSSVDVDFLCEEAAMGTDKLLGASAILKEKLSIFKSWDQVPRRLAKGNVFIVNAVRLAFNMPKTWAAIEINSEVEVATARLNGELLESVADLREDPITVQNIMLVTTIFDALFSLRHFIEAPTIRFRPFAEGPSKKAYDLGVRTTKTRIPPSELVMKLLEGSVRHLVTDLDGVSKAYFDIVDARSSGELFRRRWEALRPRVIDIAVACFILIAAFTARRTEEIKMLERDCLAGNDADGWWMKCYIEKTSRERTWIPIPNIVARAVNVLCSFHPNGDDNPKGTIFEYLEPISGRIVDLAPEGKINDFARTAGAIEYANDNGENLSWGWQTRQFRRFFAVLYMWRYKGKFESLSHHLRHFNLDMTNDYVTLDPENAKEWTREVWNFRVDIMRDLVSGRTTYTGPMGERLNKLVKRLREKFSDVQIIPEFLAKAVIRQMDKASVVLTPKPWVTCGCPRTANGCAKAACRKKAGFDVGALGPDFAAAGPTVCPGCPWALIGSENIAYYDEELRAIPPDHQGFEQGPTIFSELRAANVMVLSEFRDSLTAA